MVYIVLDFELALATGVVHVPDLAENRTLRPAHVMNPHHAPHDSDVARGVTAIQLVLVIQVYGNLNAHSCTLWVHIHYMRYQTFC